VLGDVGEQDLVDDHAADGEAHDRAEAEHVADRRRARPVRDLALDVLLAREQEDVALERAHERLAHPQGVGAGLEVDQAEVDEPREPRREHALEVRVARDQAAVDPERRSEGKEIADLDAPVVHLDGDGARGLEALAHGAVLGAGLCVEERDVRGREQVARAPHLRQVEDVVARIEADDEDVADAEVPGVPPEPRSR
jgi:hypothetical protein